MSIAFLRICPSSSLPLHGPGTKILTFCKIIVVLLENQMAQMQHKHLLERDANHSTDPSISHHSFVLKPNQTLHSAGDSLVNDSHSQLTENISRTLANAMRRSSQSWRENGITVTLTATFYILTKALSILAR